MGIQGNKPVAAAGISTRPTAPDPIDLVAALGFEGRAVLAVGEVAKALCMTIQHTLDLIDEGQLEAINIGGATKRHYRIPVEALRRFLDHRRSL